MSDEIKAMISKGIKLGFKETGSTYTDLEGLLDIPDMGGEAEKVEVTTLADSHKKYIPGIVDFGDLSFKFLYDNSNANTSYRRLKALVAKKKAVDFEISYPDNSKQQFKAIPTVKRTGVGVNGRLEFVLNLSLQSDVTEVDPT